MKSSSAWRGHSARPPVSERTLRDRILDPSETALAWALLTPALLFIAVIVANMDLAGDVPTDRTWPLQPFRAADRDEAEIGRASWRERVCT